MLSALLFVAVSLSASDDVVVLPPDVVRITNNDSQPLELVSQTLSKDGKDLTIVLTAEKGSFFLGLDFTGTEYRTAKIIVKDSEPFQRIDYFTKTSISGASIDLLTLKGVRVVRLGDAKKSTEAEKEKREKTKKEKEREKRDCVITFNPAGYKVLPPSGMLRYIALPEDK